MALMNHIRTSSGVSDAAMYMLIIAHILRGITTGFAGLGYSHGTHRFSVPAAEDFDFLLCTHHSKFVLNPVAALSQHEQSAKFSFRVISTDCSACKETIEIVAGSHELVIHDMNKSEVASNLKRSSTEFVACLLLWLTPSLRPAVQVAVPGECVAIRPGIGRFGTGP